MYYTRITALMDVLTITVSFLAAYLFRFTTGFLPLEGDAPAFAYYIRALFIVIPVYLIFFRAYGLYDGRRRVRRIEEIFLVFKAASLSIIILMGLTFLYRGFSYSRLFLGIHWAFSLLFISSMRYALIQWEYHRKVQKKELIRVLMIGGNRSARQVIKWAKNNPHYGHDIIGVLVTDAQLVGKHLEGVPILGISDQCENFIKEVKPNQVVLADTNFSRERRTGLVVTCEDQFIELKVVADVYGLMTRHVDVEYVSSVPLIGFKALPLDDVWNRTVKRGLDFIVALIMVGILSPFFIISAFLIKLSDRGPIFYTQKRVGRDQREFDVIKFRTMKVNAESETGPVWAKANDTRRTSLGSFLRKSNLDELPQLFNVLRGEMSLVGPRPERPHFVGRFREDIPRYMARHKIKSGLTGWAQVNGFRGNTSIHERIKYDLFYMENWSLLFDLEILFMTFSAKALRNAY